MNRIVPVALAAALVFVLAACSSVTSEADITPQVTFGQPDVNDDYAHVVTLIFSTNGQDYYSCTGTLLSATVVLTAGHCVEEADIENVVTYVRNTQDAMERRTDYPTFLDWLDAEWIMADDVIPHPNYADYADFPFTYDVGLVILDDEEDAFDGLSTYGELAQVGLLDDVKGGKPKDRQFTVVGYGMQGVVPAFYSDEYERYYGTTTLINVNSAYTGDGMTAVFTNNPGKGNGEGGSCYGDSGGPVFYGATNQIAAIVSFGITPCIGPDFQFRMDTEAAQEFVFGERPELE